MRVESKKGNLWLLLMMHELQYDIEKSGIAKENIEFKILRIVLDGCPSR